MSYAAVKLFQLGEHSINVFGSFFVTFHPDVPGEVKGKSSNEAFGGRVAYDKLFMG